MHSNIAHFLFIRVKHTTVSRIAHTGNKYMRWELWGFQSYSVKDSHVTPCHWGGASWHFKGILWTCNPAKGCHTLDDLNLKYTRYHSVSNYWSIKTFSNHQVRNVHLQNFWLQQTSAKPVRLCNLEQKQKKFALLISDTVIRTHWSICS